MSRVERVRISREESCSGKYQTTFEHSELMDKHDASTSQSIIEAQVWYNDDGTINEEFTYSDEWKRKNKLGHYKKSKPISSSSDGSASRSSSSSSSSSEEEGSCIKLLFTIIPILPVWWIIKLFLKAGASTLTIVWWLLKSIFYIVTWPIRIFMCCCLDKEGRRFLPKLELDIWPAYSFKKF